MSVKELQADRLRRAVERVVLHNWLEDKVALRPMEIAKILGVTTQKLTKALQSARIAAITIGVEHYPKDYPNDPMLARDIEVTAYEPSRQLLRVALQTHYPFPFKRGGAE